MRIEVFFKKFAKDQGVKIAEKALVEIRKKLNTPYPPASRPYESPHRRTGNLRDKVRIVRTANGARLVAWAPYSGFLEHGTKNMDPRPFMQWSINEVIGRHKDERAASNRKKTAGKKMKSKKAKSKRLNRKPKKLQRRKKRQQKKRRR